MHKVRFAHDEGFTDLCFATGGDESSNKSGKFLTSGQDGDVRIWQNFDDPDIVSFRVGDKCTALAQCKSRVFVGDELNELKMYSMDEGNEMLGGVLTSFTLPITCIACNKSGTMIVCGSADFTIHLIELPLAQTKPTKVSSFSGHQAPVLSICFDPLDKYFLSTGCDATARFWSTQTHENVKTVTSLFAKSNEFADSVSRGRAAWHQDGGLIAIPANKDVQFYERETWSAKFSIKLDDGGEEFSVSIICFSPDGTNVLAATSHQQIFIYSIISRAMVFQYAYSKKSPICSLAWNPANVNEVLFCDIKGNIGQVKASIKSGIDSSQTVKESKGSSKNGKEEQLEMNDLLNLIDEDDQNSNDSVAVVKKAKSKSDSIKSPMKKRKRLSDEEENSNDTAPMSLDDDEDESDDLESIEKLKKNTYKSVKKEMERAEKELEEEEDMLEDESSRLPSRKVTSYYSGAAKTTHAAFQSSSTPLNLPERYMVWNSTGIISQFNKEEDNSIEIEFHNVSLHHTIHLKNQYGYTMADMSRKVVALASPGSKLIDDELDKGEVEAINPVLSSSLGKHSRLACILLDSLDSSNKEWSVEMPRKEYIKCICASHWLVACATTQNFVRVFDPAGTQRQILALSGSPVSLTAYENSIFVVYNTSGGLLGYSLFHLGGAEKKQPNEHGTLALSGQSDDVKLEWIGFSDEGNPYYYDSNGFLFTKVPGAGGSAATWTPIAYMKHGLSHKSDSYWVVGIAERSQKIRAILCKSSSIKYPVVLPRPTISLVSFTVPLLELEAEKTKLEQEYQLNKHFSQSIKSYDCNSELSIMDQGDLDEKVEESENAADQALMKAFVVACKISREQRALEIAYKMSSEIVQYAIKFATQMRFFNLANQLNSLAEKKAKQEAEWAAMANYKQIDNIYEDSYSRAHNPSMSYNNNDSIRGTNNVDDNDEPVVISEKSSMKSSTFLSTNNTNTPKLTDSTNLDSQQSDSCSYKTPTMITTPRINPFAKNKQTPASTTIDKPKSIMSEIEETLGKQQQKDKSDVWKPPKPASIKKTTPFGKAKP